MIVSKDSQMAVVSMTMGDDRREFATVLKAQEPGTNWTLLPEHVSGTPLFLAPAEAQGASMRFVAMPIEGPGRGHWLSAQTPETLSDLLAHVSAC